MERIQIFWNGGQGNNILAELMALWGGLLVGCNNGLKEFFIYGDSSFGIDAVTERSTLTQPVSQGWLKRTKCLWRNMDRPSLTHIYRELNTRVDGLSKKGIGMVFGIMQVHHIRNGHCIWANDILIP